MATRPHTAPKPPPSPKPAASVLYQPYATEQMVSALIRLADPDLVLQQRGLSRAELRKLETDDEIAAALETRREAVVSTPWRLEPFDGEPVQWLADELTPHIELLLRGAWSAVPYGYSVIEAIYRQDGPRIGLAQAQEKPLEWFEPTRDGALIYTPPTGGPPHLVDTTVKFLLTRRNPTYRNPYGEALLSRAYWPWFFRHNGWRFWMSFMERFAEPLLLGKVAGGTRDATDYVEQLQALGYQAIIAVPVLDGVGDITAVTPGLAGEFERVEAALVQRIQRLILGQTLTSNVGDAGSYAAAKVHNEVRDDKRRADLRMVTPTAQRLVDALWTLNGFAGDPPHFVLQDDAGLELERAERDAKLAQAGICRFTEQYLLDAYDLVDGHFTIPAEPIALAPMAQRASAPLHLTANGQRFSADQELVEDLVDATQGDAGSPISASALRRAILAATDESDLVERLAKLYEGEDAAAFQDLVQRALFAADTLGFYAAEKRVGV